MKPKTELLVVDDDPLNVELLKAFLESDDYEVVTASNGEDALDILARRHIDLVLLDVRMPMLDGFEVTRRIRADVRTQGLPVILLTALHQTKERIIGIEAGCDDFITKPFDKLEVMARIKTLLRLNYYRSQVDEKAKFERVIQRMHDGLIVCDPDLKVLRSNQQARELLGTEDLGEGWVRRLCDAFELVGLKGDLGRDLSHRGLDFDMVRLETAAAGRRVVSFSSSLIMGSDGAASSLVIVLHDATKQREEQAEKQEFLALMSQQLRAPLAVSMEHLALLLKSTAALENKPFQRSVEIAVEKVTEFLRMTEKIFDLLTVNASARTQPPGDGAPMVHAGEVEALVRAIIKDQHGKKVECRFDLPSGLSLPMGEGMLRILLKNLIENAVRFNDQKVVKMSIAVKVEGARARVVVSDNGRGIADAERKEVFDAFHQGPHRKAGTAQGLGLGLSIVKKIVDAHGGEMRVDPVAEGGTSISFTLPLPAAAVRLAGVPA